MKHWLDYCYLPYDFTSKKETDNNNNTNTNNNNNNSTPEGETSHSDITLVINTLTDFIEREVTKFKELDGIANKLKKTIASKVCNRSINQSIVSFPFVCSVIIMIPFTFVEGGWKRIPLFGGSSRSNSK